MLIGIFAAFSIEFGGLGWGEPAVVVLTLAAGCRERRAGHLGKGGSSSWSWDWGQDPSMPALWRHVFRFTLPWVRSHPGLKPFISHGDRK